MASPDSVLPELSGDERDRPLERQDDAKELTVRVFDGGGRRDWIRVNGDLQETMKPPASSPQPQRTVIVGEASCDDRTEGCGESVGDKVDDTTYWTTRVNGDVQEFLSGTYSDNMKSTVIVGDSDRGDENKVKVKEEVPVSVSVEATVVPTSTPAFWLTTATTTPSCRINGVMPELIGGGVNYADSMKPPVSSPQRCGSAVVRTAPTVIMGEVGGVRTMVWSQPPAPAATPELPQAASTSASWSSSSVSSPSSASNSEESAAQLLLNLGQERAFRPPQTFPVPLNMERLWAGDLSQLPTSQQLQALNLTTAWPSQSPATVPSTAPAWLKNGEFQTPEDGDDDDQPMICMICEDKATGLHYGIITCEGSVLVSLT